jgi:hypothetical protein
MKGEKEVHRPHHISIPPKDAIAIVPPKKVRTSLHLRLHLSLFAPAAAPAPRRHTGAARPCSV